MPRWVALFAMTVPLVAQNAIEAEARVVIEANCTGCHGAAKMAGFDMRDRASLLKGGGRGAAIAPGRAAESLLYKAVRREGELKMPPGKKALSEAEVALIARWIDAGAPWGSKPAKTEAAWWSFRKPLRPVVPGGGSRSPIDAFIQAKLQAKGLRATPPASKRELVRRAYFDLLGLPPSADEVAAFVADESPDAWAKLIDQLLASPRYGERWGRRWLDVVRYGDTGGYETDVSYANAWRYRDYVIESFNRDKPYNVFVQEQVAGDEMWPGDLEREGGYFIPKHKLENLHRWLGTGLYTIGPMSYEYALHVEHYRAEWQADAVDTTASAFLGLTFGCARCHDHKFDAITQKDYYKMAAMFAGSVEREIPTVGQYGLFEYTRFYPKQQAADEIKKRIRRMDVEASGDERKPKPRNLTPEQRDLRETLLRQLGEAYLAAPARYATASILAHTEQVPPTHVLVRGEYANKGDVVQPGFPASLNEGPAIEEPASGPFVPQRRKALAEWLTSKDHPLTARVMVNRIWQGHFGRGIVATPNDFGRQGDAPTHPELLDWLAVEFMEKGWSVKALHKAIMMSDTYRQSSAWNESNGAVDRNNVYLWRMNRRRLEAEEIRDAVLAVSGQIHHKLGGPPVAVPLSQEELEGIRDPDYWPVSGDESEHRRRSVYLMVKRSFPVPMLQSFDAPDPAQSCARRDVSTVAPQALAMMNSGFVRGAAQAWAVRLKSERDAVGAGFRAATGREPTADERRRGEAFLQRQPLDQFCLLLFNLNEFLYVE